MGMFERSDARPSDRSGGSELGVTADQRHFVIVASLEYTGDELVKIVCCCIASEGRGEKKRSRRSTGRHDVCGVDRHAEPSEVAE